MEKLTATTKKIAAMHDTTMPLLTAMYDEFRELSKKKPDSAASKTKISMVNRLLEQVRIVLTNDDSLKFLDLLDNDNVPQVSDVVLILSQYVASMSAFKKAHHGYLELEHTQGWCLK